MTSGVVTLTKENNFVGISIGGGAPLCPCLYIAQVCQKFSVCFLFIVCFC